MFSLFWGGGDKNSEVKCVWICMGNAHWGLWMNCGWNSFYANGPACAKSVLESCHLFDMELPLQNRHIKWQMAWLGSIFHLLNQTGKRGRLRTKRWIWWYTGICTNSPTAFLTHAHTLLLRAVLTITSHLRSLQYMTKTPSFLFSERTGCRISNRGTLGWSISEML